MKNKFKIVAFFLAIICVATIAYGCGKSDTKTESTDFIPTMTASAAEVSDVNFGFEEVYYTQGFTIYRETSTDALFVRHYSSHAGGLCQMLDPETGKPLTYSVWLEKYAK